jgi:hypothetical protein
LICLKIMLTGATSLKKQLKFLKQRTVFTNY